MLTGNKVIVRAVKRTDRDSLLKMFNDVEVTQYLAHYLPMTEMAEEKWIESHATSAQDTDLVMMIDAVDGETPKTIGTVGLHRFNRKDARAEFSITIGETDYWSQGYGTEAAGLMVRYAFEQLNLNRLLSKVFDFNARSIRLHKKVGFTEEGRIREYTFKSGSYHDCLLFGLLRREWMMTENSEFESKFTEKRQSRTSPSPLAERGSRGEVKNHANWQ
ncbi:MAG: GNAT family N-acetyltransferase [Dehalococcoidales bacterium]|nr:GNAT family N-acetyltransferase [Dehalococcoidales bacterium]